MNDNGDKKVFELAPVKTAEQIAGEVARKTAPEARRAVHFSGLPAAAKFFYDAILDLSFLHCYGGSGRGKLFASIGDLARLLQHSRDSISSWAEILTKKGLVWTRPGWPKTEWRITALCPAPETDVRFGEYAAILGKAAALSGLPPVEPCGNLPHGGGGGRKPQQKRKFRGSLAEIFRIPCRKYPHPLPRTSAGPA